MLARIPKTGKVFDAPEAIGELKYRDTGAIDAEIARYKRLSVPMASRFREFFMNAPSPGIVATTMLNAYYKSHQDYLDAIARELHVEYKKVVDAGFVLQIDAPTSRWSACCSTRTCRTPNLRSWSSSTSPR
jgi:5-methyltetrahydropteroyltriglutamate--homocysteine methyltransferase